MLRTDSTRAEWLRSVLETYEAPLVRYAFRIVRNLEGARDVVQDTFLRLCRERDLSRVRDHIAPWLFTVCRNRAFDVRRKEARAASLDEGETEAHPAQGPQHSVMLEQREVFNQLMELLAMLPENQQEVIRLKFQNDLSYKEISSVTGLSVSNVGFLIHTGLKTVRQSLKSEPSLTRQSLRRVK